MKSDGCQNLNRQIQGPKEPDELEICFRANSQEKIVQRAFRKKNEKM